jgi:tRNA (guanosine-2'-O-)-methyltransferase
MSGERMRGFFGIGIYEPKSKENLGSLWRHAYIYGATYIFTIGNKYKVQCTDTTKAIRHIPLFHYHNEHHFLNTIPKDTKVIGVENRGDTRHLQTFVHPERAVYLLGSEGSGLNDYLIEHCDHIVKIDSHLEYSLNVSTAGTLVMYDRYVK